MYSDFLGEQIAEQIRIGTEPKPNPNNPVTKSYRHMKKVIEARARELGQDAGDIALQYVEKDMPTIQKYVLSKGEQPRENPVELAVQAYANWMKDVADVQRVLGISRQDAEIWLQQAEGGAAEMNSAEADNFLGAILGGIESVVNKAANKAAKKREDKGKKPGFWGFLAKATGGKTQPGGSLPETRTPGVTGQGENLGDTLRVLAGDVLDDIKKNEKKKEMQRLLPIAIVVVIVVILLTVLLTRKANA